MLKIALGRVHEVVGKPSGGIVKKKKRRMQIFTHDAVYVECVLPIYVVAVKQDSCRGQHCTDLPQSSVRPALRDRK